MTRSRALLLSALGGAVVVVVAIVIVLVLVISYVRKPLPERGGEISLPGLKGQVSVLRDDRAVPQIYASDPGDLFRVQGYVNAEDRFFEMDLRRHVTAGRLSELVGSDPEALKADKVVRTLGWRRVAEKELATLDPKTRTYLESYAQGVNDYIDGRSPSELSVSYTILGRANPLQPIEPWTPVDSLAWLKAMAWDLRSNYEDELARARAVSSVHSIDRVEQLYPEYPYSEHKPIISTPGASPGSSSASTIPRTENNLERSGLSGADVQTVLDTTQHAIDSIPNLLGGGDSGGGGLGSNSWVVGGSLTESGLPLLANDPHLGVSMPGIWTQVGLHCNTVTSACPFDVAGFGFAGLPGVVIGHNARISWGLTNLNPDVTDFYLEKIDGDKALHDTTWEPLVTRPEKIEVAGGQPVTITVRETRHGPLLSDVDPDVAKAGSSAPVEGEKLNRDTSYGVSLAWTALQPGHSMDALLQIDVATDFTQFRAAVLKLDAPAQNVVYADVDGHIGYQAPGRIPVRGPGEPGSPVPSDGTWPHPGWDSNYDWKGFVPLRKLPYVQDPPEGFIVAANQAVSYPVDGQPMITTDWDYGYRSQRIRDILERAKANQHPLTVADMRVIQSDTFNGIADLLVPFLLDAVRQKGSVESVDDKFTLEAVQLLEHWDYTQDTDSAAAAYFNVVWATVLKLTFGDELPDGFKPDGGDRWFEVVRSLLDSQRDAWWDDRTTNDVVESRNEVLRRALVSARLELTTKLGKDPTRWRWGRLHQVTLKQTPLGGSSTNALLRKLVNRGPYEAPGGSSMVDAFAWDASAQNFDVTQAPSMRMIVDLSNLDDSRWVDQTGISGHPGDSHYDDQIDTWLAGDDFHWPFSAKSVRAAVAQEQTFKPTSG